MYSGEHYVIKEKSRRVDMKKKEKAKNAMNMKEEPVYKNGQAAQLNKIVKDTYRVVGIGVVLLVLFTAINIVVSIANADQLESCKW